MPVDPVRLKIVFIEALAHTNPADRAACLEAACGGDAELRSRVEALLRASAAPDSLLDDPASAAVPGDGGTVDLPGGDSATGAFVPGDRGTVDLPSDTSPTGTYGPDAHRPKSMATGALDPEGPTVLLKGYGGTKAREKTIPSPASTCIPEALDRLIELYTATNKPDEVKKWRAERAKYPPAPLPPAPPPREKK